MKLNIHIVGAVKHFPVLKKLLLLYKLKYRFLHFIVYDSFSNCSWSGGRLLLFMEDFNDHTKEILNFYIQNGIDIGFLFSNSYFKEDKLGEMIIEQFPYAYVVASNIKLVQYIKHISPHIKTISSIIRMSTNIVNNEGSLRSFLQESFSYFDLVVPRQEIIFSKVLEEFDVSRFKLMMNDICKYYCPYWKKHFQMYHKLNLQYSKEFMLKHKPKFLKIHECWLPDFNPYSEDQEERKQYGDEYGMVLYEPQLIRLMRKGFNHFKISGRELFDKLFESEVKGCLDRLIQAYKRVV